jgi:hypothetical protein
MSERQPPNRQRRVLQRNGICRSLPEMTLARQGGPMCGQEREFRRCYSGVILAACLPFGPCFTSKLTFWFSCSDLKPLPWTSEKCANRSSPPPSGVMKPKPFASLNHFTVPVAIFLIFPKKTLCWCRFAELSKTRRFFLPQENDNPQPGSLPPAGKYPPFWRYPAQRNGLGLGAQAFHARRQGGCTGL